VSDNIRPESGARKAGRGFLKALRALLGEARLRKAKASVEVLRREFRAGEAGEPPEEPPRAIAHRVVPPTPPEAPPPASGGRSTPPARG
jgi:hypothetical protein